MKIHEYQARELMMKYGIPVPPAILVRNPVDAGKAYDKLVHDHNISAAVVKAQVHAGGRGKGGGVKLVKSAEEARKVAADILSKPLVTPQTGPEGVPVTRLLVAAGVKIAKEYYIGMVTDRKRNGVTLMASVEGGMDIEEVARTNPEAIMTELIPPATRLRPYQARKIAYGLGLTGQAVRQAGKIMHQLCDLYMENDANLVEINPLVVTEPSEDYPDGRVLAIDSKMDFDTNALFRHEDLQELADPTEEDEAETRARQYGLSYIKLDGNIGCLVNGAGLAMATMDMIKLNGGEPANFLDVGGSASEEAVTEAFRIILSDSSVKAVLVNIFGGIAKCDTIANAIVAAAKEVGFKVPLIVRLEGTNVEPARKILEEAKEVIPTLVTARDLTDAARKVTESIAEPAGA